MKFYRRFPDRALAGMAALTPGQRGIYNSVIDLLYSRDGVVPCMTPADDYRIAKSIAVAPQTWRTFKRQLMLLGKIRITAEGWLDANGVKEGRNDAETHSDTQRKRVSIRWQNYKLANELKAASIPLPKIPMTKDKDTYSSTSSNAGASPPTATEPHASVVARNGSSSGGGSTTLTQAEQDSLLRAFERLSKAAKHR